MPLYRSGKNFCIRTVIAISTKIECSMTETSHASENNY